jgi:hypothetical protein
MKQQPFCGAYNMTEILVSLLILGVLITMSFQLLNPNKSDTTVGRKIDTYVEHVSSIHKRIVAKYGVTPLNVDLDGNCSTVEEQAAFTTGVPNFVRSFDSVASFRQDTYPNTVNGRATYLQYPSNIRVWLYPEEFTWMQAPLTELQNLGFNRREFMIIEAVPGGVMTGLPSPSVSPTGEAILQNSDVVLIHIDDQTGRVRTVADLATQFWGPEQNKYYRSFYDRYKDSIN